MAVRLQMKLGVVAEHDRLPDSPDTLVIVEPNVGSVARSKGLLYLLVTSRISSRHALRGDAPRRRDDPQRVLLRRVGRDPRLHPEGDHDREQAARPPGGPARPEVHRRQRPDRHRAWPSCAATRCTSRRSARPRRTSSARPGSRPSPTRTGSAACRRATRAGRLARRDLGRRLARAGLPERRREARPRRAQGRDAHAPPAIGDGAPPPPVRRRRRRRQRRRDRVRGRRGLRDRPRTLAGPGQAAGAARRRPGPLADPARRQRPGGGAGRQRGRRERQGRGRRRLRPRRRSGSRTSCRGGSRPTGG